jgi:hypothetical protein
VYVVEPQLLIEPPPVVEPPPPTSFVNTTAFPYWPSPGAGEDDLIDFPDDYDSEWLNNTTAPDDEGLSWQGVRKLGEGSAGRVGLWVQVNQEGNIVDVSSTTFTSNNASQAHHFHIENLRKRHQYYKPPHMDRYVQVARSTAHGHCHSGTPQGAGCAIQYS